MVTPQTTRKKNQPFPDAVNSRDSAAGLPHVGRCGQASAWDAQRGPAHRLLPWKDESLP